MGDRARRAGYKFGYYVVGPLLGAVAVGILLALTFAAFAAASR